MGATAAITQGAGLSMGETAAITQGAGLGMGIGSQLAAGEYNAKVARYNAKVADIQAKDAIRRGEEDALQIQRVGRSTIGAQRAALAAQGVDVNLDTADVIQQDTAAMVAQDVVRARNNARREAWGYKVQAKAAQAQGKQARFEAVTGAAGTLLGGSANIYKTGLESGAWTRAGTPAAPK